MSDFISRQTVIDHINRLIDVEKKQGTDDWGYGRERVNAYEAMLHMVESEYLHPSVDSSIGSSTTDIGSSIDCISRESALEILDDYAEDIESGNCGVAYSKARTSMCDLPSVEIMAKIEMEWIPVSQMLPKDGDTYIVNIEYKGEFEGVDVASYNPGGNGYIDGKWDTWNDWIEDESKYYHVTAWMPLPDPYKEDE